MHICVYVQKYVLYIQWNPDTDPGRVPGPGPGWLREGGGRGGGQLVYMQMYLYMDIDVRVCIYIIVKGTSQDLLSTVLPESTPYILFEDTCKFTYYTMQYALHFIWRHP